ncbi:MAG: glycosyltransferase [Chitinivibrionales bacterium]|nr:glycosyltransferase [Chitinivibrionales bacterium]MBD3395939.1 glycosyltransferase [Chitinivibrionales bacterium]
MKLLEIIHVATPGGAEKNTRLITKAFRRLGLEVTLVYPPGPYAPQYESLAELGVECICCDLKRNVLSSVLFVRRLLMSRHIELIHSHMHGADFIASAARLGLNDVRHFSTIHFLPQDNYQLLHRIKSTLITAFAFHRMHRIFAPSTHVAVRARREYLLPRDRVVMLLNSIDFEEMRPDARAVKQLRARWNADGRTRLLVCAGALVRVKGHGHLIRAMAQLCQLHDNLKLILLGEGDRERELKTLARERGVDDYVHFVGYQPNIVDWLSLADIYVQPSLCDTMPRALLEAMYMGLPVVTTSLETISEVVTNGVNGITVPPASADSIVAGVRALLGDPVMARELGRAARRFVTKHCSMDSMARSILDCLDVPLSQAGPQ